MNQTIREDTQVIIRESIQAVLPDEAVKKHCREESSAVMLLSFPQARPLAADGLVITGPTGTNVNDVAVLLLRGTFQSSQRSSAQ